jgi:hypothetical protein
MMNYCSRFHLHTRKAPGKPYAIAQQVLRLKANTSYIRL